MPRYLHITNGDSAADLIKDGPVAGDVLPWRDPMHHGPFPAGKDLRALSAVRARYLAGGRDEDAAVRGFALRDAHLAGAGQYDEVVLWFEHDLLDQLQILQILDWFSGAATGPAALTMICIDRFEGIGNFRGLGQLDSRQLASLFDTRRPVTPARLAAARHAWRAFRDPDPRALERVARSGDEALPFLCAALCRHLEEYPWVCDGLTRTERQILTLVAGGVCGPGRVFVENMACERVLFMGDWPTYRITAELCSGPRPLLSCTPGTTFRYPPLDGLSSAEFCAQRLSLTRLGEQVLSGEAHGARLVDRDCWLGGVHLYPGGPVWAWDSARGCLTRSTRDP